MDLENTWKALNDGDKSLEDILEKPSYQPSTSLHPLSKLRKNLIIGIIWGIIISAGYLFLFFYFPIWQVRSVLALLLVFNSWMMLTSWLLYHKTPPTISPELSLKDEIEKNIRSFQRWWKLQEGVGLFVYPFAASGGFIMGGVLGSGKPAEVFLSKPEIIYILLILIAVIVPVSFYLARFLFRHTYGKHLDRLKMLAEDLNSEE